MEKEDLSKLKITRPLDEPPGPRRLNTLNKRKMAWLLIILAVLLLLGFLYGRGLLQPAQEVTITTVSLVYPSQAVTTLNASGYVVAQRKAAVASKGTGRLEFLAVEEGSLVKKGQIIARLENADLQAASAQARANLDAVRANLNQIRAEIKNDRLRFERYQKLIQSKAIAQSDFDATEAKLNQALAAEAASQSQIKAAEAALRAAEVALEYTLIRAPFDGVILTKNADVGEVVAPFGSSVNAKAAVVTMADLDSLIVEADVSEINLGKVRVGQPCEITLDAFPEERFPGQVHMIVPTADRSKATVLTKVKFLKRDDRVLPEMSAKVAFLTRPLDPGEKPKLGVNPAALSTKNGKTSAFLLNGEAVREVPVTKGPPLADLVEITSGLKAGDKVVLNPSKGLKDGNRVKVAEK
jgi:RND family efflux transporter MFP subunit